jgi:hypothetical protein
VAVLLAIGFPLAHKAPCRGGGCLTHHSHYARVRLGGLTIWRVQCTTCRAVCTVLPHFVLRYRQMPPAMARDVLLATPGGLSLELCAVLYPLSPMTLYRLVCAVGRQSLVTGLPRCGLPWPVSCLADEKHTHCLTDTVYLPTIGPGRVLWHLGDTTEARAAACTESYGGVQRVASYHEPSSRVKGGLMAGCDSTSKSMRALFPGARRGHCLRHALLKLPGKRMALASPVRKALRSHCHTLWYQARRRRGLRVCALGQRLRRLADHVATTAGAVNGARVRRWSRAKQAGWYAGLDDPRIPVTSTLLDQAHNAIERKLCMMKGFHPPKGRQQALLTGLAPLSHLVPYHRRAQHAGPCGVEVEGGRGPSANWILNLQILTSGGFR